MNWKDNEIFYGWTFDKHKWVLPIFAFLYGFVSTIYLYITYFGWKSLTLVSRIGMPLIGVILLLFSIYSFVTLYVVYKKHKKI